MGYIHLVGKKITGWIFFVKIASQDAMTIRKAVVQCQELQKSGKLQDQSEWDPESWGMDAGNEYLKTFLREKPLLQIDT